MYSQTELSGDLNKLSPKKVKEFKNQNEMMTKKMHNRKANQDFHKEVVDVKLEGLKMRERSVGLLTWS